ncbi:hypothetical protein Tco_1465831 [Tanacetum coccineum]
MASNQAIKYAFSVESLTFHNKNIVGVFSYPETAPSYHVICKYLMNCPLAEAFTKTPSVVYQNLLGEFWCTAIATHLNSPTDNSKVCPLKEYTIKFSVMNDKRPLILDFKTFIKSTGFNYAKDAYVSHPSHEVLGGNYSLIEQVNSIQQLFAYCLLTGIKGPEASGSLPQKRKKPKSKKPPTETKPADKGLPSIVFDEGAAKITSFPEGPHEDKDSEGLKPPANMEPQTNHVPDLSGTGAKYQETDEEEVFAAGDDIVEDTQADEEEHQFPSPNKDKPEPSHTPETQVSDSNSSSLVLKKYDNILPLTERQLVKYLKKVSRVLFKKITKEQWAQHEEVVVSYADLRASIEGYYEENVDHIEQTDKVIDAAMNSLDKNSIARSDLLNALNGVTETLKAIQDVVKEDLATALSEEKHLAEWDKSSTFMAWNLGLRMTAIKNSQDEIRTEVSSLRQDTSDIKSMMTKIY